MTRHRNALLAAMPLLACFNGDAALHKPCNNGRQCGVGQQCIDNFCDGGLPRQLATRAIVSANLSQVTAIVTGNFTEDPAPDFVGLSLGGGLELHENLGAGEFQVLGSSYINGLSNFVDMDVTDLDGDDKPEFLALTINGFIEIVRWNGSAFAEPIPVEVPSMDLFAIKAADVAGDGGVDVIVAASSGIYLLVNDKGTLGTPVFQAAPLYEPWDVLVVGKKPDARILAPESNDQSFGGAMSQAVRVMHVANGALVPEAPLDTQFQNPWGLAAGDFLGGDEIEVAVIERRLDGASEMTEEGTTTPGRVRFFRLDGATITTVGELDVGVGALAGIGADLDDDGKDDLVLANTGEPMSGGARIQVYFGSAKSEPDAEDLFDAPAVGDRGIAAGSRLAAADVDEDGKLEVLVPDFGIRDTLPGRIVIVEETVR